MTISVVSTDVDHFINNTLTTPFSVNYPTTIAGRKIVLITHMAQTAHTISISDAGFTSAVSRTSNGTSYIWRRDCDGTESGSFTVSASDNNYVLIKMFTLDGVAGKGAGSDDIDTTSSSGSGAATGMTWPALTIATDNCFVMATGEKPANASGFNTPSPWTNELAEGHSAAANMCYVCEYVIQTAHANVTGGAWTISTGDSAQSRNTVAAVFKPLRIPTLALLGVGT